MPRKPRIHFPGAVYHVMLRGNAGDPVFFNDQDRFRFYLFLQQAIEKFHCRIHGFCLMDNHIHLIVQVAEIPLARVMQNISLRYTKWINYSQGRTGHLFQGRYKALLIDADAYLLQLVSYVHLNPVRAGMTTVPEQYRWSGHLAYLGRGEIPWLTTDWVLSQFSPNLTSARQGYEEYVLNHLEEGKQAKYHSGTVEGIILGEDHFAEEALRHAACDMTPRYTVADIVSGICQAYSVDIEQLRAPGKQRPFTEARALAACMVLEAPHLTLTELGKKLNRTVVPLGRAARKLAQRIEKDPELRKRKTEVIEVLKKAESQT